MYYYEERTCPRGLAFDPELETCNYQGKVATCSRFHSASDPSADKTNQQQTTQSLLSYHGELPEPEKIDEEASLSSSSNPSLYMLDLPTLLSDSSEDAGNQLVIVVSFYDIFNFLYFNAFLKFRKAMLLLLLMKAETPSKMVTFPIPLLHLFHLQERMLMVVKWVA